MISTPSAIAISMTVDWARQYSSSDAILTLGGSGER
jgi:hypothetical protein